MLKITSGSPLPEQLAGHCAAAGLAEALPTFCKTPDAFLARAELWVTFLNRNKDCLADAPCCAHLLQGERSP